MAQPEYSEDEQQSGQHTDSPPVAAELHVRRHLRHALNASKTVTIQPPVSPGALVTGG
jgi:hypothetical protein